MTPRQEADEAVLEFAALIAQRDQEISGHRKPPTVTVTESVMDPQPFDIALDPQALSSSSGRRGGSPPPPPGCPTISVVCDAISASKTKCGFAEFTHDDPPIVHTYLVKDESETWISTDTIECGLDVIFQGSFSTHSEYDTSTCTPTTTCDGSYSHTNPCPDEGCTCVNNTRIGCIDPDHAIDYGLIGCFHNSVVPIFELRDATWPATCDPLASCTEFVIGPQGCCSFTAGGGCTITGPTITNSTYDVSSSYTDGFSYTETNAYNATLSSEYTTATLIANTEAALPAYDDDFDDACSASRDQSEDETSYTIQRFKPKFTIATARADDLVICYNEHFVPDVGDPVDTPKTVTIPAGDTDIIGDEVMEPDTDGETTITDVTCCP